MSLLSQPKYANLFGFKTAAFQNGDDDLQTILNLAATAELLASTHYLAAINSDLGLDATQVDYLKTGFLAEQDHLELLMSLGAEPVVNEFYVPETLFSDKALFATITEVAETAFTAAYLAATRIFVNMGQPAFAVTAAQISAVEAEHRALARQIGGSLPNNLSYEFFQFMNVSDAVPVLQPFLDGSGDGFVGPVAPPTADDIAGVRAQAGGLGYDSTVLPYAAMASENNASMSSSDGSTCSVTNNGSQSVNIRRGPGTNFGTQGVITAGSSANADGQTTSNDGQIWYRLSGGGWVRNDVVSGSCGSLPTVSA